MEFVEQIERQAAVGEIEETESRQSISDIGVAYQIVTNETSMVLLSDERFAERGIERRNLRRSALEAEARNTRATLPVKNRRVDAAKPAFQAPAPSGRIRKRWRCVRDGTDRSHGPGSSGLEAAPRIKKTKSHQYVIPARHTIAAVGLPGRDPPIPGSGRSPSLCPRGFSHLIRLDLDNGPLHPLGLQPSNLRLLGPASSWMGDRIAIGSALVDHHRIWDFLGFLGCSIGRTIAHRLSWPFGP
jgi:hypothetical protein